MRLVDSTGWVEYFTQGPLASIYARHVERLDTVLSSPIVLFEVYRRIKRERGEEAALLAVIQIRKTRVEPVTEMIALTAADLSLAYGLAMADSLIYATALLHQSRLVTSDSHFAGLAGVEYHPKP